MTTLAVARSMLRVNHAGELTARRIYEGQLAVLRVLDPETVPLVQKMYEQEQGHFVLFEDLVKGYGARPTILQPLCNAGGWLLGAATAFAGRSTAMACTEAVETVVGNHYSMQLRELLDGLRKEHGTTNHDASQTDLQDQKEHSVLGAAETHKLATSIAKCRDEELEHLDAALEHGARSSPIYKVAFPLIAAGVSAAIALARRF
ncbi:ubiquinone biosynthesis monooxygenase Coq7 [Mitosporidium daphniae]|uniref:3-demethoxyubiquinol 3-hydroxylase n=1 Tax=Mitosporidium daphniae TaxID=1485682 RepID=A0A098VVQ0_9MICR|nr:uncharacterized protein DI09_104p100 [Mitosporidium daphniae]KGG53203.1 hypothetical protein DI09_104p100 [Mitosporidium daphniae]|eukprot:XP_013239630.1 uncharacterized protein DI09_104p100 [Mitosporidium daphniae]